MIEVRTPSNQHTDWKGEGNQKPCGIQLNRIPQPASIALSMCLVAEGALDPAVSLTNTMEWQTAAAHAVIKSLGMSLINPDTDSELTYNKENLRTAILLLKRLAA